MSQQQAWVKLRADIDAAIGSNTPGGLLRLDLNRGRGLLCRALLQRLLSGHLKPQEVAAVVSQTHQHYPEVTELLLQRTVALFKKGYTDNNHLLVDQTALLLCALTTRGLVEDILVFQIFQVLLDKDPTPRAVQLAVLMLQAAAGYLEQHSRPAVDMVFGRLRDMLQLGVVPTSLQRLITEAMRQRRDGFPKPPAGPETEPIFVDLAQEASPQSELNHYRFDPDYEATQKEFEALQAQIFPVSEPQAQAEAEAADPVTDMTSAALLHDQKSIYLTIMSSMSADEAVHKLAQLARKHEIEQDVLLDMVVKCCAQEKTYSKYFGVVAEKLCRLGPSWKNAFTAQVCEKYDSIYQYEGAQLRNIGKLCGHLVAADALDVADTLGHIEVSEEKTTSAGRVFLKFLFQQMVEELGVAELKAICSDDLVKHRLRGMFPVVDVTRADANHIMFSINYFTAIGLGVLTEEMREVLKLLPEDRGRSRSRDSSWSRLDSSGSYSRSSLTRSYSRSRSGSRSRSRSWSRSRSASRSPRSRSASRSRSRSPAQ